MRAASALAILAAGCLSRPTGRADDDAVDAAPDGRPDATLDPAWPVAAVAVGASRAGDFDADLVPDLAVATATGVYVLAGGPGFGAGYRTFVPTPTPVLALDVADLGDTAAPELAVLVEAGGVGRLRVHRGTGPLAFAAEGWARDLPDLEPTAATRGGLWMVDSDGDGRGNIVATDHTVVVVGEPAAVTAQGITELTAVTAQGANATYFTYAQDVLVLAPGAAGAGTADLVIDDYHRASIFRGDGSDRYLGTARQDVGFGAMHDATAHGDLDGDGRPELLGGYGGFIGGTSLGATPSDLDYQGPALGGPAVQTTRAARLAQLDGDAGGRLDLAVMRHVADSGAPTATEVVVIRNLVLTSGVVDALTDIVIRRTLPGLAVGLEVGDFDGDGRVELRAVGADGALPCLVIGDNVLDDC